MENNVKLRGKKILIVDDELDIIETLEDLLTMCETARATNFKEAEILLLKEDFDIAILDIMGVEGYRLLELCKEKDVLPVMLTANALSVKDTIKSFKKGAASFIPKEEMINITLYLNDILEAKNEGQHPWRRWLERFADFYAKKFTPNWKDTDREFWDKLNYHM